MATRLARESVEAQKDDEEGHCWNRTEQTEQESSARGEQRRTAANPFSRSPFFVFLSPSSVALAALRVPESRTNRSTDRRRSRRTWGRRTWGWNTTTLGNSTAPRPRPSVRPSNRPCNHSSVRPSGNSASLALQSPFVVPTLARSRRRRPFSGWMTRRRRRRCRHVSRSGG